MQILAKQSVGAGRGRLRLPVVGGVCLLAGLFASGCASTPPAAGENVLVLKDSDTIAQAWQLCQKELKDRGFELDRVNRRDGVIETFPLTSRQWFEFWRSDVVDPNGLAESSLHTIRRRATLRLLSAADQASRLRCEVTVERLAAPPVVVSGRARSRGFFRGGTGAIPGLSLEQMDDMHPAQWVALGNDPYLEADIIGTLEMALGSD